MKSERFLGREKPGERGILDHLGMEDMGSNDDKTTVKTYFLLMLSQVNLLSLPKKKSKGGSKYWAQI
jgi:hypothetical protein